MPIPLFPRPSFVRAWHRATGAYGRERNRLDNAESVTRTREIEEFTNLHFIHPVSIRLTRLLARLGVSPNSVSFAGMLCGVLAGVAYYHYDSTLWTAGGFCLMVAWHILDGTDGQLARLTNSQSEFGKIIDGICDYVTFIAVYVAFGLALQPRYGPGVWALIAFAGACHAVQSAAYEVQQQEYNFWGRGKKSAALPRLSDLQAMAGQGSLVQRLMTRLDILYVRIQYTASGVSVGLRDRLAFTLARCPDQSPSIRRRYREVFAPSVRAWTVMSANYRTAGIFVCALSGVPLLYFGAESVVLSLAAVILVRRQRPLYEGYMRFLETVGGSVRPAQQVQGEQQQQ